MDGGYGDDLLAHSNKDELIKEFLRKNFLKFYINIYKVPPPAQPSSHRSKASTNSGVVTEISGGSSSSHEDGSGGSRYMLDIHLFKGTVYVFNDFVRKFMHVITASCSLCTNNSCCSSSNHSNSVVESGNKQQHHHDYNLKIMI